MLYILRKRDNIDESLLNAVTRLILRVTRHKDHALEFYNEDGVKLLLNLRSVKSPFQGFITMSTLIIRHVLEHDDILMKHTMEKVIKSAVASSQNMDFGGIPKKEIYCILRCLAPACARNEEAFEKTAQQLLCITLPMTNKGDYLF